MPFTRAPARGCLPDSCARRVAAPARPTLRRPRTRPSVERAPDAAAPSQRTLPAPAEAPRPVVSGGVTPPAPRRGTPARRRCGRWAAGGGAAPPSRSSGRPVGRGRGWRQPPRGATHGDARGREPGLSAGGAGDSSRSPDDTPEGRCVRRRRLNGPGCSGIRSADGRGGLRIGEPGPNLVTHGQPLAPGANRPNGRPAGQRHGVQPGATAELGQRDRGPHRRGVSAEVTELHVRRADHR